jgi:hypothetical protein
MGWDISSIDITPSEPIKAGEPFVILYAATNNGYTEEPPHTDHIEMWRSDGAKPVDEWKTSDTTRAGDAYAISVDVPAQHDGFYDIKVTLHDGTGLGRSLHIQ